MLTLRIILFSLFIWLAVTIYSVYTDAAEKKLAFKVHVTPRPPHQLKTSEEEVMSMHDNDDGTVSIYISACGAMMEVIVKREDMMNDNEDVARAVQQLADKVCR